LNLKNQFEEKEHLFIKRFMVRKFEKNSYVMEFCVEFEYDQFRVSQLSRKDDKKSKHNDDRRNKRKYYLRELNDNILWEFEIKIS
jgi:hypothetical protein